MNAVVIDYEEMDRAAPQVTDLQLRLTTAAARLRALDLAVEMPPGVRGRVTAELNAARSDLTRAAGNIDGLGPELARRASLARLADALNHVTILLAPRELFLHGKAYRHRRLAKLAALKGDLGSARSLRAVQFDAEKALRRLARVKLGANVLAPTIDDLLNPYLSRGQQAGRFGFRTLTTGAEAVGTSKAAEAAGKVAYNQAIKRGFTHQAARLLAARAAFAVGGPVGVGVGVAWTVLDSKFDITEKVGDTAAPVIEGAANAVGDGAQAVDDHVLDPAGNALGDGVEAIGSVLP